MDSSLYKFQKNEKPYERSWELYVKDNQNHRMLMVAEKTKVNPDYDELRQLLHKKLDNLLDQLWKPTPSGEPVI